MYFRFEDISIKYGKKQILENISVNVPKGKIVTIVGRNGCGKSSLLKTAAKAVRQTSGRVLFEGKDIKKHKVKDLAKKIAYLPQVHTSPPDIDVYTLVSYGRFPYLKLGKSLSLKDSEIVNRCIEITDLTEIAHQKLGTLSGGERQRAWIAMTLCQEPSVLILDEPTTYLDISHQIETLDLIRSLNERLKLTIVMVLHDINLAARYSDEIIAINEKKTYAVGSAKKVLTKEKIKDIFNLNVNVEYDSENNCPYFIPISMKQSNKGEKYYEKNNQFSINDSTCIIN